VTVRELHAGGEGTMNNGVSGLAPILRATGLKRHYRMGETLVRALDGVDLCAAPGEFVGLLGTSGSGKSTLLNLLAGLDRPTGGSLEVFGRDISRMSREELSRHRRENVGMIFQSFNLLPRMTAEENVALALVFAGVPADERTGRAAELLHRVGLGKRRRHRPSELSGGEQQRVAIARALANRPAMLLADEPTGNLDSRTAREILAILSELNSAEGKTIVMVTHDAGLAGTCAHRTVTLADGRISTEVSS
jgi:putative ABC transport system ATP-binding protein